MMRAEESKQTSLGKLTGELKPKSLVRPEADYMVSKTLLDRCARFLIALQTTVD